MIVLRALYFETKDACANKIGISSISKEETTAIPYSRREFKVSPSNLFSNADIVRTGRQKKPLEVVGVYDPIPRYPALPTGEVLENQNKIKKISMNIERVKYWLSVGAQPSDHCARLLEKVNYLPSEVDI